jgi:curved DNA-binding protein CbpA
VAPDPGDGSGRIYDGLGPSDLAPLLNKGFSPEGVGLTPEDYFVLTRVDGRTSLRQLVLISGFPESRALAILKRLRAEGAILFPGEAPPPPRAPEPRAAEPADAPARAAARIAVPEDDPLLAEDVDLGRDQKRAIVAKHRSLANASYFDVLEVAPDADRRTLKAAYRRLSKEFHPDRFFGKRLGSFKAMLAEIFDLASSALEVLSDAEKREVYVASLATGEPRADRQLIEALSTTPPLGIAAADGSRRRAQTAPPIDPAASASERARAAKIYEDAALHHVTGELEKALPEFAEAIAIDPQPRYLRRAAEAALRAQELRLAEEYAKKAQELDANNASTHRVLAKIYVAAGRPADARSALEAASRLDPENPHIAAELRDLQSRDRPPSSPDE